MFSQALNFLIAIRKLGQLPLVISKQSIDFLLLDKPPALFCSVMIMNVLSDWFLVVHFFYTDIKPL